MRRPGETMLWTAAFSGSLAVHAVLAAALVLTPRPEGGSQRETVITIQSTPQTEVERTEIAAPPALAVAPESVSVAAQATDAFAGLAADEAEAVTSADTVVLPETTESGEAVIAPVEEAGANAGIAGEATPIAPAASVDQLLASLDEGPAATAREAEPDAASIAAVDIPPDAVPAAAIENELAASVADETSVLALTEPVAVASSAPVAGVAVNPTDVAAVPVVADAPSQSGSTTEPAAAAPATAAAPVVATEAAGPVAVTPVSTSVVTNPAALPDEAPAALASALPLSTAATVATPAIGEAASVLPVGPSSRPAAAAIPSASAVVVPTPVEVMPAPASTVPVAPPRVAGLIRPDEPQVLTPRRSPQEIRSTVASLSAGERASSDDGCFLAQPIVDGEDIEVDFFAASSARMRRFHSTLEQAVEYPLALRQNIVSPAQCAALAFAGGLAGDERASMSIELVSAAIPSGGELMGLVENIGRRWFYLLVVDGEGKVHEIDGSWMSAVGPGAVVFHAPMTLTGQAGDTVQLLLAVASDEILEMVWLKEGYEAGSYFDQLRAEIGVNGGRADFGIAPFVIR